MNFKIKILNFSQNANLLGSTKRLKKLNYIFNKFNSCLCIKCKLTLNASTLARLARTGSLANANVSEHSSTVWIICKICREEKGAQFISIHQRFAMKLNENFIFRNSLWDVESALIVSQTLWAVQLPSLDAWVCVIYPPLASQTETPSIPVVWEKISCLKEIIESFMFKWGKNSGHFTFPVRISFPSPRIVRNMRIWDEEMKSIFLSPS